MSSPASPAEWRWAVGVTTAPRGRPTLEPTLDSVRAAGFGPVHVFAEPGSPLPAGREGLAVTRRGSTLGGFPNWYASLTELVLAEPRATAYLLLQDDVRLSGSLRAYLEGTLPAALPPGVYSPYCPSHYEDGGPRGFRPVDAGWEAWGALAYFLPPAAARRLLADRTVLEHRPNGPAEGLRNVDSVVGWWCRRANVPYLVHRPSLAEHLGETSTLWPGATATGRRQAGGAPADAAAGFA